MSSTNNPNHQQRNLDNCAVPGIPADVNLDPLLRTGAKTQNVTQTIEEESMTTV